MGGEPWVSPIFFKLLNFVGVNGSDLLMLNVDVLRIFLTPEIHHDDPNPSRVLVIDLRIVRFVTTVSIWRTRKLAQHSSL